MPVARELVCHLLGQADVNHVDALKQLLGVETLDVVLIESMQEYMVLMARTYYFQASDTSTPETDPA